ncbi:endo-1,4-beta-xylanase [Kiritimatiellaeota bacterium B1221]|nr:endo-1,4-beta-xylanase [Kiritimatiellaeota bacterium B1221]
MRLFAIFLVWVPLISFALPGSELLDNGSFESVETERFPAGWECGGDGEVRLETHPEFSALHLRATGEKQFTFARQTVALPAETPAALLLVGEVRLNHVQRGENTWHSGRIMLSYLDKEGREIRNAYGLDRLEGNSDWEQVSRQFPLESGATAVRVELQLFYPSRGEIAFRNLHLRALNVSEAGAWRKEADERISKHRMAALNLEVVDGEGQAIADAEVAVRMRRHAYPFGTAVKIKMLLSDESTENKIYQGVVTNFFNSATFEGALKDRVIKRQGIDIAVDALHWLQDREVAVRGHVLIWPSWRMTHPSYKENEKNPDVLNNLIREHFRRTLTATRGMTVDWDVLNEPTFHHDVIDVFGKEIIIEWFKWAREFSPDVALYLNENNILLNAGNRQRAFDWIQFLKDNGAPIDGLGIQGHMWHRTMPSGQNVLQDLDALTPLGVDLQLTEYSANSRFTESDEARYLDELLHAWFSHPATVGFTAWGFKDDLIWTDNAFMFREDWSLKPAGRAWLKRIYQDWWTEVDGKTDDQGQFQTQGFKGEYVVEVRHAGRRQQLDVHLGDEGTNVKISLDNEQAEVDVPETRLGSFNPWTTGKLPAVREANIQETGLVTTVSVEDGTGAWALVPADPEPHNGNFRLRDDQQNARDLYLRFDLSRVNPDMELNAVTLHTALRAAGAKPGRIRIHALSHRFVNTENELGLDWMPTKINLENAPGRSAVDGGFDLGDARVLYVGDLDVAESKPGSELVFRSRELRRVAAESAGAGLTLILSAPDEGVLSVAAPALKLEVRED